MRPILRKVLPYEALRHPFYSIDDFALANAALDCADENERRLSPPPKE